MQAIAETLFDLFYLTSVTIMGVVMIRRSTAGSEYRRIGIMALVLGFGDAFHLISRVYALWTTGIEANAAALGFGKLITSITMTFFYLMLYSVWKQRYTPGPQKGLDITLYVLAAARIVLIVFPQNAWFSANPPLSWGIYRNIPFFLMGVIILMLFFSKTRERNEDYFKPMWLAIGLSFLFYAPVVLLASTFPIAGALMIPKTLAYLWIVWMGYTEQRNARRQSTAGAVSG
jgi:hypothetical protein